MGDLLWTIRTALRNVRGQNYGIAEQYLRQAIEMAQTASSGPQDTVSPTTARPLDALGREPTQAQTAASSPPGQIITSAGPAGHGCECADLLWIVHKIHGAKTLKAVRVYHRCFALRWFGSIRVPDVSVIAST